MPKFVTNFGSFYKIPNPGLWTYLDRVENGQPDEYRTPFYKDKSLEWIMEKADSILTQAKIQVKWPSLYAFETDLGKKVGPMSIMKPLRERMGDIEQYYDSILLESKPVSEQAIKLVQKEWRKVAGLRIRSKARTLDEMKLNTNSGSPYFTKRKAVVDKTSRARVVRSKQLYFGQYARYSQTYSDVSYDLCATIGWRGQEGGPEIDDVKQRVVWMFPFGVNLEELRVYQPFKVAMQKSNLVPSWNGMDYVDECVTKMFDTKGKNDLIVCTDFYRFDQHFNRTLQDVAHAHIKYLFHGDKDIDEWLKTIFPIKYTIPLCISEDKILVGDHGMGSGSGGTNDDETMAHRTLQHEAALNDQQTLNPYSQCLGDDGILTYPGITAESVMQTYTAHGLEMNPDKQYVSKHDCVYLRRWHHEDYRINGICVGVYSIKRAFGRLAEQERYLNFSQEGNLTYKNAVRLRTLSICENFKFHPCFDEAMEFVIKGYEDALGIDDPEFYDNIEAIASEFNDYMPDFMGYTKSQGVNEHDPSRGIANWRTVQFMKSRIKR